jgi:hypothetical protein
MSLVRSAKTADRHQTSHACLHFGGYCSAVCDLASSAIHSAVDCMGWYPAGWFLRCEVVSGTAVDQVVYGTCETAALRYCYLIRKTYSSL